MVVSQEGGGTKMMHNPHLLQEVAQALERSSFVPLIEVLPVERVPDAFRVLASRKAIGKLVIDMCPPSSKL